MLQQSPALRAETVSAATAKANVGVEPLSRRCTIDRQHSQQVAASVGNRPCHRQSGVLPIQQLRA